MRSKTKKYLTTEQLAKKLARDVKQMSGEEKAKVREHLSGLADAARGCAAEEAAMLNYDGKGKPVN
jgi:hypothetical protein